MGKSVSFRFSTFSSLIEESTGSFPWTVKGQNFPKWSQVSDFRVLNKCFLAPVVVFSHDGRKKIQASPSQARGSCEDKRNCCNSDERDVNPGLF